MNSAKTAVKRFIRDRLPPPILMRHIVSWDLRHGEPELPLVGMICDPSTTMVDVGANLGVYSYVAAKYAAQVHALEPNPVSAAWIRKTAPANVAIHEIAASDRAATTTLYVPKLGGDWVAPRASLQRDVNPDVEMRQIEILTQPLDALDFGKVGFVKIDVEGHEQAVLRGAAGLIARQRPVVQVECEERHVPGAVASATRFFAALGYRGFFWQVGMLHPIERFDPARDQRPETLDQGDDWRGTYINNFIFVHPARAAVLNRLPSETVAAAA